MGHNLFLASILRRILTKEVNAAEEKEAAERQKIIPTPTMSKYRSKNSNHVDRRELTPLKTIRRALTAYRCKDFSNEDCRFRYPLDKLHTVKLIFIIRVTSVQKLTVLFYMLVRCIGNRWRRIGSRNTRIKS